MARYYNIISKDDFILNIRSLMLDGNGEPNHSWAYELPAIISKDISKVMFDFENCTGYENDEGYLTGYLTGYHELVPGFHTFWVSAGGDWEIPINFLLYWGDNRLRAYIPKDGNIWNKKYKCAYGSEGDSPHFDYQTNPEGFNEDIDYRELENNANSNTMINEILGHVILNPKTIQPVLSEPIPDVPTVVPVVDIIKPKPKPQFTLEYLQRELNKAVKHERYEMAAMIRDQMKLDYNE